MSMFKDTEGCRVGLGQHVGDVSDAQIDCLSVLDNI